ncbi:MAG: hypothetical protein QNK04_05355 [Myxococcota bacterium]|nr:hypothetical protein [Myxococcota bacterium]
MAGAGDLPDRRSVLLEPLHPAVVHFPIVLAVLAPLVAVAVFWAIRTGRADRRAWLGVVGLQLGLVGVTGLAVKSGEREEERVERVVAERHIEAHEEAAERFLVLSALVFPLAIAGLLTGPMGRVGRTLTVALSFVATVAAAVAGHSGGELVYRHGAASAYVDPPDDANGESLAWSEAVRSREDDDD